MGDSGLTCISSSVRASFAPGASSNVTVNSTDGELVGDAGSDVMEVANPDGSNTVTVLVAVTEFPASSVHACVKVYTPTWLTSTSSTVTVTAGLWSMASEHVAAGCIYRSPSSSLMLLGGVITGSVRSNVKDAISDAKFPLPTLSFALLAGVCTVTSPSPSGVTVNVKEDAVPVGRAGLAVPPVTRMSPANVTSSLNVTVNTALVEFVGDCSLAVSDVTVGAVRSNSSVVSAMDGLPFPAPSRVVPGGIRTVTSPSPAGVTVNVKEDAVPVGRAGLAVPPVTRMSPANVTSSLNVTVNTASAEFVGDCSLAVSDVTVGAVRSNVRKAMPDAVL